MKNRLFLIFIIVSLCFFSLTACKPKQTEGETSGSDNQTMDNTQDENAQDNNNQNNGNQGAPDEYSEGLEFTSNNDGTCFVSGLGTCADSYVKIPPISPDGDTVTGVGETAFLMGENITSVYLPNSVTAIGAGGLGVALKSVVVEDDHPSFVTIDGNLYSKELDKIILYTPGKEATSFKVPDGVTIIGDYAFAYAINLVNIELPDGLDEIGPGAFGLSMALESINIPDSVKVIGDSAFAYCVALKSVNLPDGLQKIEQSAFAFCQALTAVKIPDNITEIEDSTFIYCNHLKSVELPDGLQKIGKHAFHYTDIESIVIPDTVTLIDDEAFGGTSIESIIIPASVTRLGDYVFTSCRLLTEITLSEGLIEIGDFAFCECINLQEIVIPKSVRTIGENIFRYCPQLKNVYYAGSIDEWNAVSVSAPNDELDRCCFYSESEPVVNGRFWHYVNGEIVMWGSPFGKGLEFTSNGDGTCYVSGIGTNTDANLVIPSYAPNGETVTGIGYRAFANCTNLTSVSIPDGITTISGYAFENCTNLTSIYISKSVCNINDYVFSSCLALKDVIIEDNDSFDALLNIGGAFYNCKSLTSITLPSRLRSISAYTFDGCASLESITVEPNGQYFQSIDGVLYSADGKTLVCYPQKKSGATFTIPDSVETIGNYAFGYNSCITRIDMSSSVKDIGSHAFSCCENLAEINLSENITNIASFAFSNCVSLAAINLPSKITVINQGVFYECTNLQSIVIPDGVTMIELQAFDRCTSLTSIVIPDSVNEIGHYAFASTGYYNNQINWTDDVLYIGKHLIVAKTTISGEHTVKNGTLTIADYAFYECTGLSEVVIADSVRHIGERAFEKCSDLSYVTIGRSVNSIGIYAFLECNNLYEILNYSSLNIVAGSEDYGYVAYYAMGIYSSPSQRGTFWVDENGFKFFESNNACYLVTYVGNDTEIELPQSCNGKPYNIYQKAFYGQTGITSLKISSGVRVICMSAFQYCTGLENIKIESGATSIGSMAFHGCHFDSITIPATVNEIASNAFWNCGRIEVVILNSNINIHPNAFTGCTLANVYFGGTAEQWAQMPVSDAYELMNATIYYYSSSEPETEGNYWRPVNGVPVAWPENAPFSQGLAFTSNGDGTCYVSGIGQCKDVNINIPDKSPSGDTVTRIGCQAFQDCINIVSVMIPDSVISVGDYAFSGCTSLETFYVGAGMQSLGTDPLAGSNNVKNILISDAHPMFTSIDGNLYTKDGKTLLMYARGKTVSSFVIPETVTSIGSYAFDYCLNLREITISSNVKIIADSAFSNCYYLETVYFNAIEMNDCSQSNIIFRSAGINNLAGIEIIIGAQVKKIPMFVFASASGEENNFKSLTFSQGSVCETVGSYAFRGCLSLETVTLPDSVTAIGVYTFWNCQGLKSIEFTSNVSRIYTCAFEGCSSLTDVYYRGSEAEWNQITIDTGNDAISSDIVNYI